MKLALVVVFAFCLLTAPLHADLLLYEGFDYAVGSDLAGQDGGYGFSGGWVRQYGALVVNATSMPNPGQNTVGNRIRFNTGTGTPVGSFDRATYTRQIDMSLIPASMKTSPTRIGALGTTLYFSLSGWHGNRWDWTTVSFLDGTGSRWSMGVVDYLWGATNAKSDVYGYDESFVVVKAHWDDVDNKMIHLTSWVVNRDDNPTDDLRDLYAAGYFDEANAAATGSHSYIWGHALGAIQISVGERNNPLRGLNAELDEFRMGTTLESVLDLQDDPQNPTSVPEPATLTMLLLGGAALVRRMRKR